VEELRSAFLVNPHDIEGLKDTIVRAATANPQEARRRMRSMRRRVREHDVARWAASFLDTLGRVPGADGGLGRVPGGDSGLGRVPGGDGGLGRVPGGDGGPHLDVEPEIS